MNATICPLFGLILLSISSVHAKTDLNCSLLLSGQYVCDPPPIDRRTQQPANCSKVNLTAPVNCKPVSGVYCGGRLFNGQEVGFQRYVPCRFVNGYRSDSALLLSVLGGIFGLDRFYLGYPALGCLKLATVGGFGLWYLADILLLATGKFEPSDGSSLWYPYYDPPVTLLERSNMTVFVG